MRVMWNLIAGVAIFAVPIAVSYAIKHFWIGVAVSAAILTAVVHVTSYFGAGYIDPFFMISVPIGALVFIGWSALLSWAFRRIAFKAAK